MIRRPVVAAAFVAAVLFAVPAPPPDPPQSSLPFTAGGTTYQEGVYNDGTHFFVDHMAGGWTGSAWKPLFVDPATGYLGTLLPAGAATSARQDALLAALGTPLQAGGAVTVTGGATAAKQDALLNALGSPLQAGGAVTVFGVATAAKQDALLSALGTPLQAGGAVTVAGVATAANQATAQASLSALVTAQGAPTDAKSLATDATSASQTALLKGQIDRLQAVVTVLSQAGGLPVSGPLTAAQLAAAGLATAGGKVDTVIASVAANRGANFTSATAVTLMAANPSRRGIQLQNQGQSSCYMSGIGAASADYNSLLIPAGGLYESQPQHTGTGAISVICPSATASVPVGVYAREF